MAKPRNVVFTICQNKTFRLKTSFVVLEKTHTLQRHELPVYDYQLHNDFAFEVEEQENDAAGTIRTNKCELPIEIISLFWRHKSIYCDFFMIHIQ